MTAARRIVEVAKSIDSDDVARVSVTLDCGHKRRMTLLGFRRRFPGGGFGLTLDCKRPHPDEELTVGERLRRAGKMR